MCDVFKKQQFVCPVLEDANAIQMALMQVIQMLSFGQLDHKTAGLMLYGLQLATSNLPRTQFEVKEPLDATMEAELDRLSSENPEWLSVRRREGTLEKQAPADTKKVGEEAMAKPVAPESKDNGAEVTMEQVMATTDRDMRNALMRRRLQQTIQKELLRSPTAEPNRELGSEEH